MIRYCLNLKLLKNPAMLLLTLSNLFGMAAYYIPYVYVTQHAQKSVKDHGEPLTLQQCALLLSAIGISNVLGRIMFGWISDRLTGRAIFGFRITALKINNVCLMLTAFNTLAIPFLTHYEFLLFDCVLFGLFIGMFQALFRNVL